MRGPLANSGTCNVCLYLFMVSVKRTWYLNQSGHWHDQFQLVKGFTWEFENYELDSGEIVPWHVQSK